MMTTWITVATADGPMQAYLAEPAGSGPHAGVLVLQEAFGVNRYVRGVADLLAAAGYIAIAPELFHRSGTHVEVPYDDSGQAAHVFAAIDNGTIGEDIRAAVAALRAQPQLDPERIGVVGFCIGGFAAILTGLTTTVASVVAFYPGTLVRAHPRLKLSPLVDRMPELRAATLCMFGERDQAISADDVAAVRAALARSQSRHEVVVYPDAGHGFHTEDRTAMYTPAAAEQAWDETLAWFARTLA